MRTILSLACWVAGTVCWAAAPAGPGTNALPKPAAAAPAAPAPADKAPKRTEMTAEARTLYAALTRAELELNAQLKVFTELREEHLKRADELASAAVPDKAQWETDLAQELRDKSSAILARLNEAARQRVAFETAHAPTPPPAFGILDDAKALKPDEFAYLSKLDERLLRTRQELAAIDQATKNLHSELSTNNTEEASARISLLFEENARQTRQLEKELSDLELRKLEFRAIRK